MLKCECLVGLVVASATAEQELLYSIPGSDKVLLGFSIPSLSLDLCPVDGCRLNITGEMCVY